MKDIEKIRFNLSQELPGVAAHQLMAPYQRKSADDVVKEKKDCRRAATLMLLYPKNDEWFFALMLRPDYDGVHGGQVSFPGGKIEQGETPEEAALRECEEEIGVDQNRINLLGKLTDVYIPPSNILVNPFVGFIDYEPVFYPDATEVERIIEVPLADVFKEDLVKQKKIKVGRYSDKPFTIEVPYFEFCYETVWGATALMISEFREMLKKA
ncbi:NUDIX hydrolase [Parvicella tangerina]|uniref:Nudix hydrolase NudL n=1 Tax=Parvicella tangerina TaxID=2829795 RepID=A0A916NQ41_9FLAO|nr:CoA pyrophosphatase [Parvicella tangerina]CAG5078231.1 putative Nudix hydrolase NudL [Parvicella tangerina]